MGMGYGAAYADVVEEKFIEKTCPKELMTFLNAVEDNDNVVLENVAKDLQFNEDNGYVTPKIKKAYKALVAAFNKKTGLSLGIGFHDSDENGDRYDEINGVYWSVGGVWQLTPAGKKHESHITRSFFVNFG
jgi:hypothetical protein